jgi:hypothetical protein
MQARTLSSLMLKTWALTLLVDAAISFASIVVPEFFVGIPGSDRPELSNLAAGLNLISVILVAGIAFALLRYSDRLTEHLFRASDDVNIALDADQLLDVAASFLGIYFLVGGLRELAGVAVEIVALPTIEAWGYLARNSSRQSIAAGGMTQIIAGMFLLLRWRGIAAVLSKLRRDSLPSSDFDDPSCGEPGGS